MNRAAENHHLTFASYQEFRTWTENQPGTWMLKGGVPMPGPPPSRIHQEISARLFRLLIDCIADQNLGKVYAAPLDVKLTEDPVYQPDLLVILKEHAERMKPTHIEGPPDLVIEVISPGTAKLDLVDKRYDYAKAGVSEYWIVDTDSETVEVYSLTSGSFALKAWARGNGIVASLLNPLVPR